MPPGEDAGDVRLGIHSAMSRTPRGYLFVRVENLVLVKLWDTVSLKYRIPGLSVYEAGISPLRCQE